MGVNKVMLVVFRWSRDCRDSRLMGVSFLQLMIPILGSGLPGGWGIKGIQRWCWGIIDSNYSEDGKSNVYAVVPC